MNSFGFPWVNTILEQKKKNKIIYATFFFCEKIDHEENY